MRAKYFIVLLVAAALNSCEFGANAVDGTEIQPREGTIFTYEDRSSQQFDFLRETQLSDEMQIKFLSKIAAIGDRDHVYGFEASRSGELMFSDVKDGDLWIYFQANREGETPIERNGEWIRLPLPGDAEYTTEVEDSVFSFSRESASFIRRRLTVAPVEQYKFYVDGYYFNARKVSVTSDYDFSGFNSSGNVVHDEQELTYLEGLGVLAEKVVHTDGFSPTSFIMNGIRFK